MSDTPTRRSIRGRLRRLSLRQRAMPAVLLPLLLGVLILVLVGRDQVRSSELRLATGNQMQLARTSADQITVFMETLPGMIVSLSNNSSLIDLLSADADFRASAGLEPAQRSAISRARASALGNLSVELLQIVVRTPIFDAVRIFNNEGDEILRAEVMGANDIPRMAGQTELTNVAGTSYFWGLAGLNRYQVHISPIELNADRQPVVHVTTPIFHGAEQAGGITIDILADSFLKYVSGREVTSQLTEGQRLILVDSRGTYLADTRDAGNVRDTAYSGYLFGRDTAGGVTLATREPGLLPALEQSAAGAEIGRNIVSSLIFNPFYLPVEGTPWTLIVLEDATTALADVEHFSVTFVLVSGTIIAILLVFLYASSTLVIRPLTQAAAIADRVTAGDYTARIPIRSEDEIGRLSQAVNTMTGQLLTTIDSLEERFQERSRNLEVAGEIATIAAGISDVEVLLTRAVALISERFDFYHVQVFLVNQAGDAADLIVSTGEAGRKMLAERWSLAVGSASVIGQVTAQGKPVIALDTAGAEVTHRPNPHLPETRSEMALPMIYGNAVIGALDIQSTAPNAFTPEDVRIFEVLANQLAVAVNNARQLTETHRQIARAEELNRRLTRTAWDTFTQSQTEDLEQFISAAGDAPDLASHAGAVSAPIAVRGEVIGTLTTAPATGSPFSPDEVALIQAVAERISLAVENARLVTETQASLAETERLYRASQIIRNAGSVSEAMVVLQSLLIEYSPSTVDVYLLQSGQPLRAHHWDAVTGTAPEPALLTADEIGGGAFWDAPALFLEEISAAAPQDAFVRAYAAQTGAKAMLSVPLNLRNESTGRLVMAFPARRSFPRADRDYLTAVADQTAIVVDNWTLLQRTQDSLEETQVLYEAGSAIADMSDAAGILQVIAERATPASVTTAQLLLLRGTSWDDPAAQVEVAATWSRDGLASAPAGIHFSADQYPGWAEIATATLLAIENTEEDARLSEESRRRYPALGQHALVVVPLEAAGTPVGALVFGFQKPHAHSERELRIYQSLAELATVSLENIRLLEQTQRRARQLQTSAEISRAATQILDIDELLPLVVNQIKNTFNYDHVQVFLIDDTGTNAVLRASTGEIGQTMLRLNWTLAIGSDSVIGQTMANNAPVIALDTADAEVVHRPNPYLPDTRSEMAIPLASRERVVGALDVQSNQPGAFTGEDVAILTSLAEQVAVALDNARLFQETQNYTIALSEQVYNLQSVLEASQNFTTMLSADEILTTAAEYMVFLQRVDHCGIVLADDAESDTGTVRAEYPDTGVKGMRVNLGKAWWRAEYERTGLPVVVPEVSASPLLDEETRAALLGIGVNQIILIPFSSSGERVMGSIGLDLYESGRLFSDEDLTLLQLFATQVATSYQNALLFQGQQEAARALEQQVDHMESLYATSVAMSESLEEQAILSTAQDGLMRTLEMDFGMVMLAAPGSPEMAHLVAAHGAYPLPEGALLPFTANPFYSELQASAQPLIIEDLPTTTACLPELRDILIGEGRASGIIVPILLASRLVGFFALASTARRAFSPVDLTLIQTLTSQVSLALQNARLFGQAQQQAEDMTFLFNVTTAAAASTELVASMETVVQQVGQNITCDAIAVYLPGADNNYLEQIALLTRRSEFSLAEHIPASGWILDRAIAEHRPFSIPDLGRYPDAHGIIAPSLRSLIAAPLLSGNEIIGLMLLLHAETDAFSESHLRLLQVLSGSLSAVVQNIRLLDDIRAANDRLRELDKIKSQFLANMSHELRTPLNSIIGFSRVILKGIDGPLTDMQQQDLETIHSSGQHLLNLINDILDQAKIEADKLSLNLAWFDLKAVIEVARSMSVGLLKDKPVRLNVEIEPGLAQVYGDEIRMRQVLLNLLSNASKFTYEGSITIAAFNVQQEDGPYVQVSVSDTGIGIPDSMLDTIFVAFEQVDGTLTRASGGTGLGLPISRSLIEMMGGEMWLESTVNVGSTFSLVIPAYVGKLAEQEEPVTSVEAALQSEAQLPIEEQELPDRRIILVIDDEVGMHQMYRRYLNKAGYTVEATSNPAQAEEIVRLIQPDLIILDVRMPERDGWDVLGRLRTLEDTAHIPVVVCSIDPDRERGLGLGAAGYLIKPFLEEELLRAVQKAETEHIRDRVLIVDDRPETVRVIVELLRAQDRYAIQIADSAQQALDAIARKKPDLILLDLNMPDMDGIAMLEKLRENPRTRKLPVVIITAEDDLAAQQEERLASVEVFSKNTLDEGRLLSGMRALLGHAGGRKPPGHNGEMN